MSTRTTVTVSVNRWFDAPAETVFDAWLNPDRAAQWLFATPTGQMVKAEVDPRVGGQFIFVDRRDGVDVDHSGEYVEIERPRRLVFKFVVPLYTTEYTTVAISIQPMGDQCELTLRHEGIWSGYEERSKEGWTAILADLARDSEGLGELTEPTTIRFERWLPGPIEGVWEYLADSEKRGKWLAEGAFPAEIEAPFELQFEHEALSAEKAPIPEKYRGGPPVVATTHRLKRLEPPRLLVMTWSEWGIPSEVTIELTPAANGKVKLLLTHSRLDAQYQPETLAGWQTHLAFLADALEGRTPAAFWARFVENQGLYRSRSGLPDAAPTAG